MMRIRPEIARDMDNMNIESVKQLGLHSEEEQMISRKREPDRKTEQTEYQSVALYENLQSGIVALLDL